MTGSTAAAAQLRDEVLLEVSLSSSSGRSDQLLDLRLQILRVVALRREVRRVDVVVGVEGDILSEEWV